MASRHEVTPDTVTAAQQQLAAAKNGYLDASPISSCERAELGKLLNDGELRSVLPSAETIRITLDKACPGTQVPHQRVADTATLRTPIVLAARRHITEQQLQNHRKDNGVVNTGMIGGAVVGALTSLTLVAGAEWAYGKWCWRRDVNQMIEDIYDEQTVKGRR
jgi:hypothetical protein